MKKRILDKLETMPDFLENIDENTIYEDTGISYDNVQKMVFSELKLKKHSKITFKRFALTLIAAVLALSVISTTVFAALGGFAEVFGELFSGNFNDENLYTVNHMNFKSDNENLQVNVLGITGDDSTVYAALELSYKDGQPIVNNPESEIMTYTSGINAIYVGVDKTLLQKITSPNSKGLYDEGLFDGWYHAEDDGEGSAVVSVSSSEDGKKIKMYVKYSRSVTPKGNTMTIRCDGFYEKVPEKLLQTTNQEQNLDRSLSETGRTKTVVNDDRYELWQIRETKLDINFELSMKLNYRTNAETMSLSKEAIQKIWHGSSRECLSSAITFSPLGVTMTSLYAPEDKNISDVSSEGSYEVSYEVSTGEEISTGEDILPEIPQRNDPTDNEILNNRIEMFKNGYFFLHNLDTPLELNILSRVIMKDGTEYGVMPESYGGENNATAIIKYSYIRVDTATNHYDFSHPAVIDVAKIKKININGFEFDFGDKAIDIEDVGTRVIDWNDKILNLYFDYLIDDIATITQDGLAVRKMEISDETRQYIKDIITEHFKSQDEQWDTRKQIDTD